MSRTRVDLGRLEVEVRAWAERSDLSLAQATRALLRLGLDLADTEPGRRHTGATMAPHWRHPGATTAPCRPRHGAAAEADGAYGPGRRHPGAICITSDPEAYGPGRRHTGATPAPSATSTSTSTGSLSPTEREREPEYSPLPPADAGEGRTEDEDSGGRKRGPSRQLSTAEQAQLRRLLKLGRTPSGHALSPGRRAIIETVLAHRGRAIGGQVATVSDLLKLERGPKRTPQTASGGPGSTRAEDLTQEPQGAPQRAEALQREAERRAWGHDPTPEEPGRAAWEARQREAAAALEAELAGQDRDGGAP